MTETNYDWIYQYTNLPWINREIKESSLTNGFDCATLIEHIYKHRLKIDLEPAAGGVQSTVTRAVVKAFADVGNYTGWDEVTDSIKDYDIAVMAVNKRINHVGLVIHQGILHSVQGMGVVYTPLTKIESILGFKVVQYLRYSECPLQSLSIN